MKEVSRHYKLESFSGKFTFEIPVAMKLAHPLHTV
jgi:hypothetical protein